MSGQTSQHILSTAANLLGFCLFVITALHVSDKGQLTIIDERTAGVAVLLAISTLFSYLSIRGKTTGSKQRLELIADNVFFIALIGIVGIICLIALNIL